jgi:hypothetical protein
LRLDIIAQVHALRDTLRPYLLRRLKEDVEKSIPPKEEVIVEVGADFRLMLAIQLRVRCYLCDVA